MESMSVIEQKEAGPNFFSSSGVRNQNQGLKHFRQVPYNGDPFRLSKPVHIVSVLPQQ